MDDYETININLSQETICILDNAQDLIAFHEPVTGEYMKLSQSFLKTTGYREDELLGYDPYSFFHPDDIEKIRESHAKVLGESPDVITYRYRHKLGHYMWFETMSQMGGKFIITTSRDVTKKKQHGDEGIKLAYIIKGLLENSRDKIVIHNINWDKLDPKTGLPDIPVAYVSESSKISSGLDIGGDAFSLGHPEDIPFCVEYFKKLFAKEEVAKSIELRQMWLDGVYHTLDMSFTIHGEYLVAVGRDITERIELERDNKIMADRLNFLLVNSSDNIFFKPVGSNTLSGVSNSVLKDLGYNLQEITQMDCRRLCPTSKPLALNTGLPDGDNCFITKDNDTVIINTKSYTYNDEEIVIGRNLTGRFKMEKEKEELAKKMSFLMKKSTDHIVLFDKKGNIKDCSQSACADTGYTYEELIGKPAEFFKAPSQYGTFADHIADGFVRTATKSGAILAMEVENYEYEEDEIIVVSRNVTNRLKLEEENAKLAEIVKMILEKSEDLIGIHKFDPKIINPITGIPKLPMWKMSQSSTNVYGYKSVEEADPFSLIHSDDIEKNSLTIKQAFTTGRSDAVVVRMNSHGTYINVSVSFLCAKDTFVCVARQLDKFLELAKIEKNLAVEKMERQKDLEAAQIFSHEAKNAFITSSHVATMLEQEIGFVNPDNSSTIQALLDELKSRANKGTDLCMNETLWRSLLHDTYEVQKDEMKLGAWLETLIGSQAKMYMPESLRAKHGRLDRILVETIINNAITNALKYGMEDTLPKIIINESESGRKIVITIRNKQGESHQNLIDRIHTGWSTEELFDKNMRLNETSKNNRNSSGHGLWVTRLAAAAMGGKVSFVVKRDCCDFIFSFPCEAHCNLGDVELPKLKVAIVDDDRVERLTVEREFGSYEWVSELYVRGKTPDECWQFPHFIIYNEIDIALFDENLYENENGSDLMIQARKLGFKGVMISRSSMEALSGLTVVGKIADGFLPKCYRTEEEIRMRISDILYHSNEVKIANEAEVVSSLTSDDSKAKSVVFLDEVQEEFRKKEPVVLTEMLQTLVRGEHYDTIKSVYVAAREELNLLLEKMVNISETRGQLECSEKSERPYRYIHQMKGIAMSVGFVKLEYFTQQMCYLKSSFRRETLNKVLPSVKLIIFESFAFVEGFLKTTI